MTRMPIKFPLHVPLLAVLCKNQEAASWASSRRAHIPTGCEVSWSPDSSHRGGQQARQAPSSTLCGRHPEVQNCPRLDTAPSAARPGVPPTQTETGPLPRPQHSVPAAGTPPGAVSDDSGCLGCPHGCVPVGAPAPALLPTRPQANTATAAHCAGASMTVPAGVTADSAHGHPGEGRQGFQGCGFLTAQTGCGGYRPR